MGIYHRIWKKLAIWDSEQHLRRKFEIQILHIFMKILNFENEKLVEPSSMKLRGFEGCR